MERHRKKPVKQDQEDSSEESDGEKNDLYALPYSSGKYKDSQFSKELSQLGFGAGGLPPLTFSHLNRNWSKLSASTFGDGLLSDGFEAEEKEGVFGPGIELSSLPWTEMQGEESTEDERGGEEERLTSSSQHLEGGGGELFQKTLPAAKRARVGMARHGARPATVRVPSSQVKRHDGGRGKKRFKLSKTRESTYTTCRESYSVQHLTVKLVSFACVTDPHYTCQGSV